MGYDLFLAIVQFCFDRWRDDLADILCRNTDFIDIISRSPKNDMGLCLNPILSRLEVPNWHLQLSNSFFVNSNMKSSGKRSILRLTALFN